jgi:hypothetical protein
MFTTHLAVWLSHHADHDVAIAQAVAGVGVGQARGPRNVTRLHRVVQPGGGGEGGREEGDMMGVSMGLGGAWVGA